MTRRAASEARGEAWSLQGVGRCRPQGLRSGPWDSSLQVVPERPWGLDLAGWWGELSNSQPLE